MRLPVLVSERCGNHWEAVVDGVNGRLFDPYDPTAIRRSFEEMLSRRPEWEAMGQRSGERYEAAFRRSVVSDRFRRELEAFTAGGSA
jgi:glycosyltransferase involved in cell wall biosynthesis